MPEEFNGPSSGSNNMNSLLAIRAFNQGAVFDLNPDAPYKRILYRLSVKRSETIDVMFLVFSLDGTKQETRLPFDLL